jgi:flagellar biosynthetic protein FliR
LDWYNYIDTSRVFVFALVLTRVSGIVITAPVFGGSDIPMQIRALLAFCLALLIMPSQWLIEINEPGTLSEFAVLIAGELIIGLFIGLGVNIFFSGISLAGEVIGQLGGLSAAAIFDPISGDQSPLLSRMLSYLAVTVFAAIGGLRTMIAALLDTFQSLPLTKWTASATGESSHFELISYALVSILSISFNLSLRIAAPVMISVLVALLVMGLLSKTLPQLNLMSIGFGINSMIMMLVFSLSIGAGIWCFQERVSDVMELLFHGLHTNIDASVDLDW